MPAYRIPQPSRSTCTGKWRSSDPSTQVAWNSAVISSETYGEFRQEGKFSSLWISEIALKEQINQRVANPWMISQANTQTCGIASVLQVVAKHAPCSYRDFVLSLFKDGEGTLGRFHAKPDQSTRFMPRATIGQQLSRAAKWVDTHLPFLGTGNNFAGPIIAEADWIPIVSIIQDGMFVRRGLNFSNAAVETDVRAGEIHSVLRDAGLSVHEFHNAATSQARDSKLQYGNLPWASLDSSTWMDKLVELGDSEKSMSVILCLDAGLVSSGSGAHVAVLNGKVNSDRDTLRFAVDTHGMSSVQVVRDRVALSRQLHWLIVAGR